MTEEEIAEVENEVNEKILENVPLWMNAVPYHWMKPVKLGAMMLFMKSTAIMCGSSLLTLVQP